MHCFETLWHISKLAVNLKQQIVRIVLQPNDCSVIYLLTNTHLETARKMSSAPHSWLAVNSEQYKEDEIQNAQELVANQSFLLFMAKNMQIAL